MQRVHKVKTWPVFYWDCKNGTKPFELRFNDRDYRVNDILCQQEYIPSEQEYSGNDSYYRITYVLSDFAGLEDGYVILGITPYDH